MLKPVFTKLEWTDMGMCAEQVQESVTFGLPLTWGHINTYKATDIQ